MTTPTRKQTARLARTGASGLTVGALALVGLLPLSAQAVTLPTNYQDFNATCTTTPSAYVTVSNVNITQLIRKTQSASGMVNTNIGPAYPGLYNAPAMTADNVMYAVQGNGTATNGQLFVISADGTVTQVGQLVNPDGSNYTTGVNGAGTLTSGTIVGSTYYLWSATNRQLYGVDLSGPGPKYTMNKIGAPTALFGSDLAYSEGYLWSIADRSSTLVRMDPATGVQTAFSIAHLAMPSDNSTFYGAAWALGNGNLDFFFNGGTVYQLDVVNASSANPTINLVAKSPTPSAAGLDGTSCATKPTDLQIT